MKYTLRMVSELIGTILKIETTSFKINYWISRNIRIFSDTYNFYITERNKLFDKYLFKDSNNNYFSINDNQIMNFNYKNVNDSQIFDEKFYDLLNIECNLDPYLIDVNTLIENNIILTPEQIICIDSLFEEF